MVTLMKAKVSSEMRSSTGEDISTGSLHPVGKRRQWEDKHTNNHHMRPKDKVGS